MKKRKIQRFIEELDKAASENYCINYDDFCETVGIKTAAEKEKSESILLDWLEENPDFEFIGDDYEIFCMKNAVIIKKNYSDGEEHTPDLAERLAERARLCKAKYSYQLAKDLYERIYLLCMKLSLSGEQYLAYCGEAKLMIAQMNSEFSEGDPLPDYLIAAKCFEAAAASPKKLPLKKLCYLDNYEDFRSTEFWLSYQLALCYDSIGNIYFDNMKYYSRTSETVARAKTAVEYYNKEFENINNLFVKSCPAANNYKWLYEYSIGAAMRCYCVLWDFEAAERHYSALEDYEKRGIPGRYFLADAYMDCASFMTDFEDREECLKRALEIMLENCYTYLDASEDDAEIAKKYHFGISQICGELASLYSEFDQKCEANIYSELEKHYIILYNNNTNILEQN